MKKKTEADFEKWIQKQVDFYVPILGLEIWTIKIRKDGHERYMAMACNYPYVNGEIKYSHSAFIDWTRGEMTPHSVMHELCHIITDPLYVKAIQRFSSSQEIKDEREKLTDMIAVIVMKLV